MVYLSIFRNDLLADQVILVTGGGSGMGRCFAHELASLGATVHIAGRTKEKLEGVAAEVSQSGGNIDWSVCDIREEDQVEKLFETILQKRGSLNSLVNNAGGQFPSPLEKMSKNQTLTEILSKISRIEISPLPIASINWISPPKPNLEYDDFTSSI